MNNEVNISILDVQTNALSQLSLKWSSRFNRGIVHPGTMSQDLPLDCLHLQIVRIVDQAGKHRLSATETAKRISETHDSHDSQCFQMFPSHHSQRCGLLCQVHLRALNAGETTLPRLLTESPRVAPSRCLVHIFGENWSPFALPTTGSSKMSRPHASCWTSLGQAKVRKQNPQKSSASLNKNVLDAKLKCCAGSFQQIILALGLRCSKSV